VGIIDTMNRRRLFLILGTLAVCVVTQGVLATLPSRSDTKARFDRIETGMTVEEVERILGRPSGRREIIPVKMDGPGTEDGIETRHFWIGTDEPEVVVLFFNDKVRNKGWSARSGESVLGKIRRWLHLN
jgi:hypothetical protein